MRKYFDKFLAEYASIDDTIRLIIADVGEFPEFKKSHPKKLINVGVAEINAIGIASGLAAEGYNVYVYGVSSFFLYRCHEILRHNCLINKIPIKFIGVGFGWKYYGIGAGHFCPDDIGICLSLGMNIAIPSKISELMDLIHSKKKEPVYIRLTADIRKESVDFLNVENASYVIVSYGEMANISIALYKKIIQTNQNIGYLIINRINEKTVLELQKKLEGKKILVIEDQLAMNGITGIVSRTKLNVVYSKTLPIETTKVSSSKENLLKFYGYDLEIIYDEVKKVII